MLSPEYLEHLPDAFVRLFLGAENSVIEDMARRIVRTAALTDTAKWQYERLRAINASYDYIMQQIERMTGQTEGELRGLFEDAGVEALEYDNRIYRYAGLEPTALEDSPLLRQQILTAYRNTQGVFQNLARTTASAGQKQFIDALDRAALQLQSGAFSYAEVIPAAIRGLAQSGLAAIRYPTGHVDKLDVATRRAVLTGVNQMAGRLSVAQADDMGCDLVETTAHAGARPSHQVWQGKVFSRSGNGRYPDFESSTGYGTGPGLCGWNCRHSFFPFFEGLSESAYPRKTLDEYNGRTVEYGGEKMSYYDATQVQRGMERAVRATKRELAGYGAGMKDADEPLRNALKEKFDRSSVTLKRQEAKLKDFTEKTGLDRQREREQVWADRTKSGVVVSFGRSPAQKARQSAERHYRQWIKGIGADDAAPKTLANYYSEKYNDSPAYRMLKKYASDVQSGWISPLSGLANFQKQYNRIQREVVGSTASNGIRITGQSDHFIQRVIGTSADPKKLKQDLQVVRRSGVSVDDIKDVLKNGKPRKIIERTGKNGKIVRSQKFVGVTCDVSVNPDTGILIQCNPA